MVEALQKGLREKVAHDSHKKKLVKCINCIFIQKYNKNRVE